MAVWCRRFLRILPVLRADWKKNRAAICPGFGINMISGFALRDIFLA